MPAGIYEVETTLIGQVVSGGIFAFAAAVATGYFAYRQGTKVAEKQADTSVEVKRLEIGHTESGWVHDSLTRCQDELAALRLTVQTSEQARFLAEAHRVYQDKEIEELTAANEALTTELRQSKHDYKNLEAKLMGYDWIKSNPKALRALADERERELKALPAPEQP